MSKGFEKIAEKPEPEDTTSWGSKAVSAKSGMEGS